MRMQRMPGVTVAAFIMGYIDVLKRFSTWVYGGGRTIPIFLLITIVLVIAANNKQQWARVAWSAWIGFGVFCGVACLFVGEWPLLALASIAISIALLVCLWHPKTTDWFHGERTTKDEAIGDDKVVVESSEYTHNEEKSECKTSEEEKSQCQREEKPQQEEEVKRRRDDEELSKLRKQEASKYAEEGRFRHLFSMLSKMAKSDGLISESEVMVVEGLFTKETMSQLGFTPEKRSYCVGIFNYAKSDPYSIFTHAECFCSYAEKQSVRMLAYKLLWDVACADGLLSTSAKEILRDICVYLQMFFV